MSANLIEFVIGATDKASGTLGKVGGAMGSLVSTASKTALAVAAAAGATTALVKSMNDAIEKTTDAATRLGTTAETLSRLEFAAAAANIETEAFNKGLEFMQRNAAEAVNGNIKVAQTLQRLGVDAQAFASMGVDEKLALMADTLGQVEDAGERARMAVDIFGKSGAEMIQVLEGGSAALKQAAADADFLGVTISKQAAANAKELGDQFDRMGGAIKGVGNALIENVGPIFAGVFHNVANIIAENRDTIVEWATTAIRYTVAFAMMAGQVFSKVVEYVKGIFQPGGFSKLMTDVLGILQWGFRKIIELAVIVASRSFEAIAFAFRAIPELIIGVFRTAFLAVLDLAVTLGKRLWDAIQGNVPKEGIFDALIGVGERAMNELVETAKPKWEEFGEIGKGLLLDLKDYAVETGQEVGAALGDAFDIDVDEYLEKADQWIDGIKRVGEVAEETATQTVEMQQTFLSELGKANDDWIASHGTVIEEVAKGTHSLMMSTADSIAGAFAQSIVYGKSLSDALKGIAKQVLAQMLQMLIRIGLQRLIASKIAAASSAAEGSAGVAAGLAQTYVNSFASAAAIPFVGWAIAPGAAAANLATATAGAAGAIAAGAGIGATAGAVGAVAHGGMSYVPEETTYRLAAGERVVSPRQNQDLTAFLAAAGAGNSGPAEAVAGFPAGPTGGQIAGFGDREEMTVVVPIPSGALIGDAGFREIMRGIDRQTRRYGVRVKTSVPTRPTKKGE